MDRFGEEIEMCRRARDFWADYENNSNSTLANYKAKFLIIIIIIIITIIIIIIIIITFDAIVSSFVHDFVVSTSLSEIKGTSEWYL